MCWRGAPGIWSHRTHWTGRDLSRSSAPAALQSAGTPPAPALDPTTEIQDPEQHPGTSGAVAKCSAASRAVGCRWPHRPRPHHPEQLWPKGLPWRAAEELGGEQDCARPLGRATLSSRGWRQPLCWGSALLRSPQPSPTRMAPQGWQRCGGHCSHSCSSPGWTLLWD